MLLRYIYSHLFASSLNEKVGFFNPVFFYFPNEAESYNNMNEKVMIGDAFILFPLFTDDTTDISRNFPSGKWHNFPTGKVILNEEDDRTKSLSGEFDVIHLYMRGGFIVPWQNTFDKYIQNSYYLRQERMNLSINPDKDNKAKGLIFFDNDGKETIENNDYIRIDLSYDNGNLDVNTTMKDGFVYKYKDNVLGRIELFGTNNKENCNIEITFNDETIINKTMQKDVQNDKFYIEFDQKEEFAINNINNIKFVSE
jgi:maltase-glucoamylase